MMILILLTDWVNQKQTRPPTLLLGLSLEEPETIFIKKEGNLKVMLQENLPLNVFSSMKTLRKELNIYFPWPMKKEKNLTENAFRPTMEEILSIISTNNGRILFRQSNDSRVITIRSEKDIEHIKNPMDNPRHPN